MLALNKQNALQYTKTPYLAAVTHEPNYREVYVVPDSGLPAITPQKDPFDYLDKQELFALKKKYRVGKTIMKKIQECYRNKHSEIELGDEACIESHLMISEMERTIPDKIKKEYRNNAFDLVPFYDVKQAGIMSFHSAVCGLSGSGKTVLTCKVIEENFKKTDFSVYVFSPTASTDEAYINLRQSLGKKKVKLINSNDVETPIHIDMLGKGKVVLVCDDLESVDNSKRQRDFIHDLVQKCLYHGRHRKIIVFTVFHDAFNRQFTKASSIEASRVYLFPAFNRSNTTKYLKSRLGWTMKSINELYGFVGNDRWCCIYLHIPNLVLTSKAIKLL